jgi:hypothetical protein
VDPARAPSITSSLRNQRPTTPEESEVLNKLGDAIEEALVGYNVLFLARATWNSIRELVYRVYDPEVAQAVLQAKVGSENSRPWQFDMHLDPEWKNANAFLQRVPENSKHES